MRPTLTLWLIYILATFGVAGEDALVGKTAIVPEKRKVVLIEALQAKMIPIQPGSYEMGTVDGDEDEKPVHTVTLSKPFWIGQTEVTQRQYKIIMGSVPSHFKGDNRPVDQATWYQAVEFCKELTNREAKAKRLPKGYVYRLPTEAEWEYCCRAGTTSKFSFGDDEKNLKDHGWFKENSNEKTYPVASKKPNPWGLYDMHGGVWEWCHDWEGSYAKKEVVDPTGPKSGTHRISRGGCWLGKAKYCRSAVRNGCNPGHMNLVIGFRIVLGPQLPLSGEAIISKFPKIGDITPELKKQTELLIRQLAAEKWADRSQAMRDLEKIGPAILPLLAGHSEDEEPEIRAAVPRLKEILYGKLNIIISDISLILRPIKPGDFVMGSLDAEKEPGIFENPRRTTLTKRFWIAHSEVTQSQYETIMGKNPSRHKGVNRPVEQVSWADAVDFCEKLTARERKADRLDKDHVYRLPTEAEWEYCCRAGTEGEYSFGFEFEKEGLGLYGWYKDNSKSTTHPVALKKANAWGLYDMHGNVWEWCHDWYGHYSDNSSTVDPIGATSGERRISRGGSCGSPAKGCRSALRAARDPKERFEGLGFRIVRGHPLVVEKGNE